MWLAMHPEFVKALAWWRVARPCNVETCSCRHKANLLLGLPYKQRIHFMNTVCDNAGVKRFGFHSMRRKSAAITFVAEGVSAAHVLMGHYRATTTDNYVRSSGLYMVRATFWRLWETVA
jgi:integrase